MPTGTTINETIDVVTPAAGESVTEGTILEWHVKVGDYIKVDDTIVEISTDKVDVELPSPASGTVSEILAEEGDTVGVGQVIARLAVGEEGSNGAAQASADGANGSTSTPAESSAPPPRMAQATATDECGPRRRSRLPGGRPRGRCRGRRSGTGLGERPGRADRQGGCPRRRGKRTVRPPPHRSRGASGGC